MAKPVDDRHAERGRQLAEWRARYPEAFGFELEWDDEVGVFIPTTRRDATPRCDARLSTGAHCQNFAGTRTAHQGVGRCWRHDTRVERAAGAWAVAHKIAEVMDISPWDALLLAVKRCAAWAAFYQTKLAEVEDDEALRPNGEAYHWVEASERVNEKLARWSKMAVDAGVQKILVERAQTEGAYIARVLNAAIAEAELGDDAERRLRSALRIALTREGDPPRPLDGVAASDEDESQEM